MILPLILPLNDDVLTVIREHVGAGYVQRTWRRRMVTQEAAIDILLDIEIDHETRALVVPATARRMSVALRALTKSKAAPFACRLLRVLLLSIRWGLRLALERGWTESLTWRILNTYDALAHIAGQRRGKRLQRELRRRP